MQLQGRFSVLEKTMDLSKGNIALARNDFTGLFNTL